MKNIIISDEFRKAVPSFTAVYMEADVTSRATPPELSEALHTAAERIQTSYELADINHRPAIEATRLAYKACGKDPNRYRPSQEQLMRRIVRGLGLYEVNALVDAGNLVSLITGSSLGIFDRDCIDGNTLTLGIGKEHEPYDGIGRGPLNICGLPVWRDSTGGIGTPTSDNERTKVNDHTTHISVLINLYSTAEMSPMQVMELMATTLEKYCNAKNIEYKIIP